MSQTLTHSRLACFRTCPRKHWMRFELGLRPEQDDSLPRRVGSAFHLAMDSIDKGIDPTDVLSEALEEHPHDLAMVAAMVHGHQERWADAQHESIASELAFELPLRNPETGAPTPTFVLAGVIDRIIRLPDGRVALMERKTTSEDFTPGADYWLRLHLDMQLSIYVIAARELGYPVETILYDVTRRPMLRPLMATPEDKRKYKKGTNELYANQRDRDETPEEFAGRVGADIASRPEHYFTQIEIPRLDQDLEECAAELWQQQKSIRAAQRMGRWYRNPGACVTHFGKCDYLSICMNRDLEEQTPANFVREDDVHPELPPSEGNLAHATSSGQTGA